MVTDMGNGRLLIGIKSLVEVVKERTGQGEEGQRRPLCTFVWKAMRGIVSHHGSLGVPPWRPH
jgi:hypothetical protein